MEEGREFLMAMSALASACTKALSTGSCSSDGRSSLLHQFPGCCLVRYHALTMLYLHVAVLLLFGSNTATLLCSGHTGALGGGPMRACTLINSRRARHNRALGLLASKVVQACCSTVLPLVAAHARA